MTALGDSLMKSWCAKVAAGDRAGTEALAQAGFQSLDFRGAQDRAGFLAMPPQTARALATVSDVIATRVGDALVVSCLVDARETAGGVVLPTGASARLAVWQWTDGAWRVAAFGSLNMPTARPSPSTPTFAGEPALNDQGKQLVAKFLTAQFKKDMKTFEAILANDMQSINFKGQKARADLIKGADNAKGDVAPVIADARATRCGDLTIVTCNLAMGQKVGFSTLPADPAPFLCVFQGPVESIRLIATTNTNKPK